MATIPLVIGGNHQNPLGVIEALGRKGIMSDAIIVSPSKWSFVLKSKYIDRGWLVHTYKDALKLIKDTYTSTTDLVMVYPCCDDAASFFDANRQQLPQNLVLQGVKNGDLTLWMRKDKMDELAVRVGFAVPQTWVVEKGRDLPLISYPCVTKSMSSVGNGKSEFSLLHNESELSHFMQGVAHSEVVQAQEFIDKEFEYQYIGLSLNGGDEIIIPGHTTIDNTTDFNNLTFLKYTALDGREKLAAIDQVKRFIRETGYTGLFSVEFMHGRDGKEYFLEMNFRNDGNGICVTAAGTNLPYIYYLWASGQDYADELTQSSVKTVYCTPEDSYLISMLKGDIKFREWYANMKKANCYVTYFKGNTRPFWALMWLQKRPILSVAIRRLFNRK